MSQRNRNAARSDVTILAAPSFRPSRRQIRLPDVFGRLSTFSFVIVHTFGDAPTISAVRGFRVYVDAYAGPVGSEVPSGV